MTPASTARHLGLAAALTTAGVLGSVSRAHACGGLFCSQTSPVNQAAEQIIFSQNDDGTVTAAIQIMYEGPSESFAWVLPVKGVPTVAVSSEVAFQRLKAATDPTYALTTTFDESCNQRFLAAAGGGIGGASGAGGGGGTGGTGGTSAPVVIVEGAGTVGPYDWEVISVVEGLEDPAQVALDWLADNGYDVTSLAPTVLRPYLQDNLNLLAFKLTKNSASGSIRPVLITYEGTTPSIPIRPTAVAANDDMGVMVYLLAAHRGIPRNYKGLELNEALIDWFNPNNNYNQVVSRAADEAEGQGFVTEFAGAADRFADLIFSPSEEANWNVLRDSQFLTPNRLLSETFWQFNGWDGFDDALRASVTLPANVTFEDFKLCFDCYIDQVTVDEAAFVQAMTDLVIKPMQDTQKLFEDLPYMTRLYTTLSAEEMTVDPVFDINPDLEDVSSLHVATQVISCPVESNPSFQVWRVDLPQGDVVRGVGQNVWPVQLDDAPAARRIVQFATSGAPRVVVDAAAEVKQLLDEHNEMTMASVDLPIDETTAGAGGKGGGGDEDEDEDDGCRVGGSGSLGNAGAFGSLIAAFFMWRRRRCG